MSKIGRNDPCPCGSGMKYKKCCLDLDKDGGMDKILPFPSVKPLTPPKSLHLLAQEKEGVGEGVINLPDQNQNQAKQIKSSTQASSFLETLKKEVEGKNFESIEEFKHYFSLFSHQHNNQPRDFFEGLSSAQMSQILGKSFQLEK